MASVSSTERGSHRPALHAADLAATYVVQAARVARATDPHAGQRIVHGYAWMTTLSAALEALAGWAERAETPLDQALLRIAMAQYLDELSGGVAMSQLELLRPHEFGLEKDARALADHPNVRFWTDPASLADARATAVRLLREGHTLDHTTGDDLLDSIRGQYRRFTDARLIPQAHRWHLADALIPDELVAEMAALGTFGATVSADHGGLGLGKMAMCVITEELSRGWIAAGSLGTRSEIAADLIASAGTEEQKARYLPGIASGAILPTAVFTEPNFGSDLGALQTRAVPSGDGWRITGAKTWITHAARSDLMTLLARTDPGEPGHAGLSMFLLDKPRGTDTEPFPAPGMRGSDIPVLGYRGMREYDLAFDGLAAPQEALLGGVEGQGFRQLMQTFESARIQTAARAVGVARRAFELGLSYARDRKQFGRPIADFPRVADKLAIMAAEIVAARELTYVAARRKDAGQRTDVEAGMAKLLAARTAWSAADASLQIHGGHGYALEAEISRVLCDARILSIFEGASEIQAEVIARGTLR
jgi:(2S)-methylsuccinyl-CoA dehydrogenase